MLRDQCERTIETGRETEIERGRQRDRPDEVAPRLLPIDTNADAWSRQSTYATPSHGTRRHTETQTHGDADTHTHTHARTRTRVVVSARARTQRERVDVDSERTVHPGMGCECSSLAPPHCVQPS